MRRLICGCALLAAPALGCSTVLGYDDVSFEKSGGSGGIPHGNGGSTSTGAVSGGGGTPGNGGTPAGGGAAGSPSSGGGAAGVPSSGGTPSGGGGDPSGGGGSPAGGGSGGSTGDPYESYRQQCVDEINKYRATEGLPPYQRWTEIESCVDGEAQKDSQTGQAHSAFPSCGESAQNECPGWGSLESTVTSCLAMMWAEGPGADFQKHGHYLNMSSTSYTRVACGFHVTQQGSVWAIQNFQ